MEIVLPKVYPILDSSFLPTSGRAAYLDGVGRSLVDAGATLLEYRNKAGSDAEVLADARVLRVAMPAGQVRLVLDDRVDVALAAGFDGVHVDAGDLPPADARRLMGGECVVGTSASSEAELTAAMGQPVTYIAFGPVFLTTTKQTSARPIGIEGVSAISCDCGPQVVLSGARLESRWRPRRGFWRRAQIPSLWHRQFSVVPIRPKSFGAGRVTLA